MTLKEVLDLGMNGILAVGIWMLWQRLNSITDRLFMYLDTAAAERREIARAQGLSTQDLSRAAKETRDKL